MNRKKNAARHLGTLVLGLLMAMTFSAPGFAAENPAPARPSDSGALGVEGTHLIDEQGNIVSLQGISLHGLTWFPDMINADLIAEISGEWGANLLRLPVYSEEYVNGNEDESIRLAELGIRYAIDADMYVIVDWHILNDGDPNTYMAQAMEFFRTIAEEYADVPNLIYEICNEPNGGTTWEQIKSYAENVIPVIRSFDENAVIVVGTPNWSQDLASAMADPLADEGNIMYALHFYAATHKEELRQTLQTAIDSGLPVFITECGLCEADGSGVIDYEQSALWFDTIQEDQIPYAVWNLSDKDESSAMLVSGAGHDGAVSDDDLTACGRYVKALLGGEAPEVIGQ